MTGKRLFLASCAALIFLSGLMTVITNAQAPEATDTPVTAITHFDLPDWLRAADATVAVLLTYDGADTDTLVTFINAATDERFMLDLPFGYVDDMAWVKTSDGVYLRITHRERNGEENSDDFINIATGEVVSSVGEIVTQTPVNTTPPPALAATDNGAGISYQVVSESEWVPLDQTQTRYGLRSRSDIVLTNAATGESISLYNGYLPASTYLNIQWFDEGQRLAVWFDTVDSADEEAAPSFYGYYPESAYFDFDGRDKVQVFDTQGEALFSLDSVKDLRWSLHNTWIMYRARYYYDGDSLCITDLLSPDESNCDFFDTWQSQYRRRVQDYQWSLDGQKIILSYVGYDDRQGGLCIIDVATLSSECPLEKQVTDGVFTGIYHEQANTAYGFFTYNNGRTLDESFPPDSQFCVVNQQDYSADCVNLPARAYYNWMSTAPSGHMLAMVYRFERGPDGACIVNLQSGQAVCPDIATTNFSIDTFGWSPDSRFFLAMYGSGPGGDDKTFMGFSIFDAETGTYRDEGYALYERNIERLWRPTLSP